MDIQKEREAFENKFPVPAHWIDFDGLTCKYICKYNAIDDQALKYQARWESWLVAKAQAVLEGFVIVGRKDLLELTIPINAVDLATHTESKTNEVREMWQQVALKLMALGISQEQSHE